MDMAGTSQGSVSAVGPCGTEDAQPKGRATAAKKKPLLPVYLFAGEDDLKRETALRRLRVACAKLGDLDFNSEVFDAEMGASARAIIDAADTLPLASDIRLVVVKNVEKLPKPDAELLIDYLADPNPTTVLTLIAPKLLKTSRLYKAAVKVGASALIDCTPKKGRELPALVCSIAASHGMKIDDRAAQELVDLAGGSSIRMDVELTKISEVLRARGDDVIKVSDVEQLVVRTTEPKPWDFLDALSERDARMCALLLARMPSQSRLGLLSLSETRLRELICAKALEARGEGARLASTLGLNEWRVKNHRRWASRFSPGDLSGALAGAAQAEMSMKSGGDQTVLFEMWALDVCGSRRG
jgi:DNA polymerase-3 subunit delta